MDSTTPQDRDGEPAPVDFRTHPARYRHWKLSFDAPVATLRLDVNEDAGLRPGYKLKLNSYDLGVDIELHDALQRLRFEHPEIRTVVLTSARDRVFCSGANIFMLGLSSHAWKVNFCRFTNETRNGMEDSSANGSLKFLAACNGTTAGGGYELALACDRLLLVDDRSSAVSLPEIPLLGVLPGTGGLTRLTDKRRVRRDLADIFCTTSEGIRGARAQQWRLVDEVVRPQQFALRVREEALALAQQCPRPAQAKGIELPELAREDSPSGYRYRYLEVSLDPGARRANLTVLAPPTGGPNSLEAIHEAGAAWWPLQFARELDDAILQLRTNHLELGTWLLRTRGDAAGVLLADSMLATHAADWFVREITGMLRRTLARLEVSSRTIFALIEPGSCFAGTLLELALAADRSYMLAPADPSPEAPQVTLSPMNFGPFPTVAGSHRLAARFYGDSPLLEALGALQGLPLAAAEALEWGLITAAPDDLDWDEELRITLEERASLSPDALTGMEANLRFGQRENQNTRIFGRLSAWQNWIFSRPNAVGEAGALKVYGTGKRAGLNWERV